MTVCRRIQIDTRTYHLAQNSTSDQMDQRHQHKADTLNLIDKKAENRFKGIGTGKDFLNRTQALRSTINKCDPMKLKSFCKAKDTVIQTKHQSTKWEKIYQLHISCIYKELKKKTPNIKKTNNPILKMGRDYRENSQ